MPQRDFSTFTLKEAMQLISATQLTRWEPRASARKPSKLLDAILERLRVFDQQNSDAGKALLIDALLAEIVVDHPSLKIWKSTGLEVDGFAGAIDYLITPNYAYLSTLLVCLNQAKGDDFVQGRAQNVAEMVACQQLNRREGHATDVFGIVSNGHSWQFYRLTAEGRIFETEAYALRNLPELLGVLELVCAECAANVPIAQVVAPAG